MNVNELLALKPGDKVYNPLSKSAGIVTECITNGVRVRWGDSAEGPTFPYTAQSTAWMHWASGAEDSLDAALDDFVQNPPKDIMT